MAAVTAAGPITPLGSLWPTRFGFPDDRTLAYNQVERYRRTQISEGIAIADRWLYGPARVAELKPSNSPVLHADEQRPGQLGRADDGLDRLGAGRQ